MKLIDLLPTVEKTEYNSKNINIEAVVNALGITFDIYNYEHRRFIYDHIKAYWLMPRLCTDTVVGAAVYFLDDELIGYSSKVARKADEDFFFISVESADKVLKFFLSLINNTFRIATDVQLSEEMEDIGFNVYSAKSICSQKVFYVPTSEYVEVMNVFRYDYNHDFDQLEVKFVNGECKIISCEEILVPYCLRDEDE